LAGQELLVKVLLVVMDEIMVNNPTQIGNRVVVVAQVAAVQVADRNQTVALV
jgi:hypothetical protein